MFLFIIQTTLKISEDSTLWHKYYRVISSMVGSGHPDKYSYEMPRATSLIW